MAHAEKLNLGQLVKIRLRSSEAANIQMRVQDMGLEMQKRQTDVSCSAMMAEDVPIDGESALQHASVQKPSFARIGETIEKAAPRSWPNS